MIDFNDYEPPARFDLQDIKERLADRAADWLPGLFPNAIPTRDRKALRGGDIYGRAPSGEGSCIINLEGPHAGYARDFSTGESAGPIDLIGIATGLTGKALFEEAAKIACVDSIKPVHVPARKPKDHSNEIAHILRRCEPIAGTLGEHYLSTRELIDPQCDDLKFHADLTDYVEKRSRIGLVAIPRDAAGHPTPGIHRTFLLDDASGKAPAGKKMLGSIVGGSVRLFPIGMDGHLGIAEGIETALSVTAIFDVPCWAGLSDSGVSNWQWPEGVRKVTIFADAGEAGAKAANKLAERLQAAGIPHDIKIPMHGDDFNDDLKRGVRAEDYPVEVQPSPSPSQRILSACELMDLARRIPYPDLEDVTGEVLKAVVAARLEPIPERQVLNVIKSVTKLPIPTIEKQLAVMRGRYNATGDVDRAPIKPPWAKQLRLDIFNNPERNEANVITALTHDEAFAGTVIFDEFRQEMLVQKPLPWDGNVRDLPRLWSDTDDVRCAEWLQHRDINVAPATVSRSMMAVARQMSVHPVRDYLQSLQWDGTPRIESWVIRYLGAEDTALHKAFGALWMISAVARIMQPGAKADHMLILEGPQGARKSTALKTLVGPEWFTDELAEVGSKDAAQQLRGVWIIEIAELDAIGRAEVSRIKAFLTRTVDRYRPAYGRHVVDVPRQCVFAGSVNPDTYLRDETGNRRFWPVRCGDIDIEGLKRDRDQLWAEAVARFNEGAVWWLTDPDLIDAAKDAQGERVQGDAWDERIDDWLANDGNIARYEPIRDVSIAQILEQALGIDPSSWTRSDQLRVASYLKRNEWERYKSGPRTARTWRYRRGTNA